MTLENSRTLRITRYFDAPPERVFDAWLDPKLASKWLFTTAQSVEHHVELDARVGGTFTITDWRGGKKYTAVGEYLEIDRPHRLVFKYGMPQFSEDFDHITVGFIPKGAGCEMTLTQRGMSTDGEKSAEQGWGGMFTVLAEVLNG